MLQLWLLLLIIKLAAFETKSASNEFNDYDENYSHQAFVDFSKKDERNKVNTHSKELEEEIKCGIPYYQPYENTHRKRRIINGYEARPHSWPWSVSLMWIKNKHHFCSGVLIDQLTVLTAAHCVSGKKIQDFKLVFGLHHIKNYTRNQKILPKQLFIHENFNLNDKTRANDIALVRLIKPVKLSHHVSPICLPNTTLILKSNDEIYKKTFYTAGWGQATLLEKTPAETLKQTAFKLTNSSKCFKKHTINTTSTFCAINLIDNSNVCYGDSGVSLTFKDKNKWYVYGIVSFGLSLPNIFGRKICDIKGPSYFTNVTMFLPWIQSKIEDSTE